MKRVFVSYTIRDAEVNEGLLRELNEALAQHCDPYIDLLHNDSVSKQERVVNELEQADQVLILESNSISESKWAAFEMRRADELAIQVVRLQVRQFCPVEDIIKGALLAIGVNDSLCTAG